MILAKILSLGCTVEIEPIHSKGLPARVTHASVHIWDPGNDTDTTFTCPVEDLDARLVAWLEDAR